MDSNTKYYITIGRSYGSGGLRLADELHKALNVPMYDKNLLDKAAEQSSIRKEIFERADERSTPTFPYIYGSAYPMTNSFYTYSANYLSDENIFSKQCETIERLAAAGSAIFVGRCSDYVLRGRPNLLSLFVTDTLEVRVANVMERLSVSEEEAHSIITKTDRRRREYYNYYTSRQWGMADNYDLCIRLSKFGTDYAVEYIAEIVRKMCQSL